MTTATYITLLKIVLVVFAFFFVASLVYLLLTEKIVKDDEEERKMLEHSLEIAERRIEHLEEENARLKKTNNKLLFDYNESVAQNYRGSK